MNRIHWQRTSAHANMLTYIEYIGELEQRRRAIIFFPDSTGISENFPPFVNNLMPGSLRQHFREEIQDGPKPPHKNILKLRIKWYGSIQSTSLERSRAVPFVQKIPREIPFKWQALDDNGKDNAKKTMI